MSDTDWAPTIPVESSGHLTNRGIHYALPTVCSLRRGLKGPIVGPDQEALQRLQTYGVPIHGNRDFNMGWNQPDLHMVPDLDSEIRIPGANNYVWLACNLFYKGRLSPRCPRIALSRQIERLEDLGHIMKSAITVDFLLVESGGQYGADPSRYQDMTDIWSTHTEVLNQLTHKLSSLGWKATHIEAGGMKHQYTAHLGTCDVLTAANRMCFFQILVKKIAHENKKKAVFSPLAESVSGETYTNDVKLQLTLWSGEENTMACAEGDMGLSQTGRYLLGGVVKYLEPITAIACSGVQSYRRFGCKTKYNAFGLDMRTAPVNICKDNTAKQLVKGLDFHLADGDTNPYLLFAALISACVDGINNKIEPNPMQKLDEEQTSPPAYAKILPKTLKDAIKALGSCDYLKESLGAEIIKAYVDMREH